MRHILIVDDDPHMSLAIRASSLPRLRVAVRRHLPDGPRKIRQKAFRRRFRLDGADVSMGTNRGRRACIRTQEFRN